MARNVLGVLSLAFLCVASVAVLSGSPAAPQTITTCGQVIDTPGNYQLSADLECSQFPPIAYCDTPILTIAASNVRLDGQGFTLSAISGVGIRIEGSHVQVRDVRVDQVAVGVQIEGGEGNRLTRIDARGNSRFCNRGIGLALVDTARNAVTDSNLYGTARGVQLTNAHDIQVSRSSIRGGFDPHDYAVNLELVGSHGNSIHDNDLSGALLHGITLERSNDNDIARNTLNSSTFAPAFGTAILLAASSGNAIHGNEIARAFAGASTPFRGVLLSGGSTGNVIRNNEIYNHTLNGLTLSLGATDNRVQGNRALNNTPFDAEDQNPACDANVWTGNTFGTVNQDCVR